MRGSELITLAIDATRLGPDDATQGLQELIVRCETNPNVLVANQSAGMVFLGR